MRTFVGCGKWRDGCADETIGPYGTGNMSFGNFDFDPEFFPDPERFIANLSAYGFDFQVSEASRVKRVPSAPC